MNGGYCTAAYSYRSHKTYDANGFEVQNRSALLDVKIYESYALYEKLVETQQTTAPKKRRCFHIQYREK